MGFDTSKLGRPRNIEAEIRVINLLAQGVPVGKVAKEVGLHRNTVCNIRKRIEVDGSFDAAGEVARCRQELAEIRREQAEIEQRRKDAEREAQWSVYVAGVNRLLAMLDAAAREVTKCRSVWTQLSLDRPLSKATDGTFHDVVPSESTAPEVEAMHRELSVLIDGALSNLSLMQQQVIRLTFFGSRSDDEIAADLSVPIDRVASERASAMDALGRVPQLSGLA